MALYYACCTRKTRNGVMESVAQQYLLDFANVHLKKPELPNFLTNDNIPDRFHKT